MNKSQFNIKISKELLTRLKRQAIMSGKTLTGHITDLITQSLAEDDYEELGITSNRFRLDSGKIGWWNPKIDEMSER